MKHFFQTLTMAVALLCTATFASAQTTAMDFNRMDCNGNMQHLFADLDAGNAVILEFFMQNCSACVTAGGKLEQMKASLLTQFPGKIKSYATGFNNSYSCASNKNWVANNGFTSIPMDSGAAQVAYYGGFGMPTIVILGGGTAHSVLGTPYIGFSNSDITTMTNDITTFLTATAIAPFTTFASDLSVFPNPATSEVTMTLTLKEQAMLSMQIVNVAGQTVTEAVSQEVNAGNFTKNLSIANLAAGLYLVKITANGVSTYRKLAIEK